MLLSEYPEYINEINKESYVYIQPKLNGWRCVLNTVTGTLYSRSGQIITLTHVSTDCIGKGLPGWLDGELYIHGYTLGQIQSMIKKQDIRVMFHCFDVIDKGVFSERFKVNYNTVYTQKIKPSEIESVYNGYLYNGFEGAVIRLDREYESGRSRNIFKLKPVYD